MRDWKKIKIQTLKEFEILYTNTARLVFNMGGAGSGKSKAVAQKMIIDTLTKPNCFYYVLRKHHTEVKKSIFDQLKNEIYMLGLYKFFRINETERTIWCKHNNSKMLCSGLYQAAKIKSLAECTNAFLEEADEFSEEDFDYVNSRVRSPLSYPNQIILNFNPPNKSNWIPARFFNDGEVLPELNNPFYFQTLAGVNCMALRTDYTINPFLPEDTIRTYQELKASNLRLYETLCLGVWASNKQGMYFTREYYVEEEVPEGHNFIYCDSAYSQEQGKGDYTCIIKATYVKNTGKICINHIVLEKNLTPFQILTHIEHMRDIRTNYIGIDANYTQRYFWRNVQLQSPYSFVLSEENFNVDKLIPEALSYWTRKKIVFETGFEKTKTGAEALNQLFSFEGKKVKSKIHDDFPDALICLIHIIAGKANMSNFLKGWAS